MRIVILRGTHKTQTLPDHVNWASVSRLFGIVVDPRFHLNFPLTDRIMKDLPYLGGLAIFCPVFQSSCIVYI